MSTEELRTNPPRDRRPPALVLLLAPVWDEVFLAPIRHGRLRADGWSRGVKLAAVLGASAISA